LAAERTREMRVAIGPEGGFTEGELALARAGGATFARVATRVLRIETAAEAAAAIVGEVMGR